MDWTAYESWDEPTKAKALAALREEIREDWRPFFCPRAGCDGMPHEDWTWNHARASQHPPPWSGDWFVWLFKAGRGSGKTRTGAETVHRATKHIGRIALIAPTGNDIRDTLVEGESGLLATAAPGQLPAWEPSKKRLTWPNGAKAFGYSGEEPDRLRGPQHGMAWCDEPAHIPLIEEVWSNLQFGLRLGTYPKIIATTTPIPTKWMKKLVADPLTIVTSGSTYDNLANLAEPFRRVVLGRYENTRVGRQEIHGEIIGDIEGALWTTTMIDMYRREEPAYYDRVVVAVDPAGTATRRSDETGIVVCGIVGEHFYVIADWSGKYSPKGWADRVIAAYEFFKADEIVVELNYGRDMVVSTLEASNDRNALMPRITGVDSRRGKVIRADPIAAMYEKGKAHHLIGADLVKLEEQLTEWVPGTDSPDRLDAMVHGATHLVGAFHPAEIAPPYALLRGGRSAPLRSLRSVAS